MSERQKILLFTCVCAVLISVPYRIFSLSLYIYSTLMISTIIKSIIIMILMWWFSMNAFHCKQLEWWWSSLSFLFISLEFCIDSTLKTEFLLLHSLVTVLWLCCVCRIRSRKKSLPNAFLSISSLFRITIITRPLFNDKKKLENLKFSKMENDFWSWEKNWATWQQPTNTALTFFI